MSTGPTSIPAGPEIIDPSVVLNSLKPQFEALFGTNTTIVLETLPAPCQIQMGHRNFELVILNMASNSHDAMPNGGVFRVSLTESDRFFYEDGCKDSRRWLEVRISDTGMGMSDYEMEHAVEPFFTTRNLKKNTGLGLSTCYGMVKAHGGGEFLIKSSKGKGTEFRFFLPVHLAKVQQLSSPSKRGESYDFNLSDYLPTRITLFKKWLNKHQIALAPCTSTHTINFHIPTLDTILDQLNVSLHRTDRPAEFKIHASEVYFATPFTIWKKHALPPGRYVELTLTDTGNGGKINELEDSHAFFYERKPNNFSGLNWLANLNIYDGAFTFQKLNGEGTEIKIYLPNRGEKALQRMATASQPIDLSDFIRLKDTEIRKLLGPYIGFAVDGINKPNVILAGSHQLDAFFKTCVEYVRTVHPDGCTLSLDTLYRTSFSMAVEISLTLTSKKPAAYWTYAPQMGYLCHSFLLSCVGYTEVIGLSDGGTQFKFYAPAVKTTAS